MAKPEWGVKRACLACGTRFYDMRKTPILCPSCGVKFDVETIFRPRRVRAPVEATPVVVEKPAAANGEDVDKELAALADDSAVDDDDDDDDNVAIEDTSDLADDNSDVPVVPKDINEEST
ncbi:MAG: TIGR02300 family protein [Alphaproteobacteria bacterium]|nr:TIGR02300 family protein [Alphaproteobacteria bacterium]MCZ6511142.1 TIGR02300 family protein [Alphaproteobacteria bacterium]MCZ6591180.1 TIGR02300 family protein [Alphaproteobacteria bacterium]MCZ6839285.1 TIGR02300 family protein [Alphaproteobacteria bacterium]